MTIEQQIITVAEWDGADIEMIQRTKCLPLSYNTDISVLYPVAKRVKEELRNIGILKQVENSPKEWDLWESAKYHIEQISYAAALCNTPPTELFAAVVNAITFLNEMK